MVGHKRSIVPDASVFLKWILSEGNDCEKAFAIREHFLAETIELKVPEHCFAEISNIIGRSNPGAAVAFISYLLALDITVDRLRLNAYSHAFRLMKKHKDISFYDAAYHALALTENAIFVTADEKYYKKTKREGGIMLLSQYR